MVYLDSYDELLEKQIQFLYEEIFLEDINEKMDSSDTAKTVAAAGVGGVASGAAYAVAAKHVEQGHHIELLKQAKRALPYAIGGAILAATLGAIVGTVKKKIAISKMVNAEKDTTKRASLKKELNNLSKKEFATLKKYKKQEEISRLKAQTKLDSGDKEKIANQVKVGMEHKKKIDALKSEIKNLKST